MYTSLCLLYRILGALCESYCQCPSLRAEMLPSIALGFHFLFNRPTVLDYSLTADETDSFVVSFVYQCSGFFRLFKNESAVPRSRTLEESDVDHLGEEYVDILGIRSLEDLVVGMQWRG